MFFLAGLTRDFPPAEEAFLKSDGFSILMRAMQGENDKLVTKSAFMLRNMLVLNPSHKCKYLFIDISNLVVYNVRRKKSTILFQKLITIIDFVLC